MGKFTCVARGDGSRGFEGVGNLCVKRLVLLLCYEMGLFFLSCFLGVLFYFPYVCL